MLMNMVVVLYCIVLYYCIVSCCIDLYYNCVTRMYCLCALVLYSGCIVLRCMLYAVLHCYVVSEFVLHCIVVALTGVVNCARVYTVLDGSVLVVLLFCLPILRSLFDED